MATKKVTTKKTVKKKAVKKAPEGLGDTVETVLEKTGIAKVAKFILGEDCGCEERKNRLNAMFRYSKPECLTEDEYNVLDKHFKEDKSIFRPTEQAELRAVYNRAFNKKTQPTNCGSCLRDLVHNLKKVYNEYKDEKK